MTTTCLNLTVGRLLLWQHFSSIGRLICASRRCKCEKANFCNTFQNESMKSPDITESHFTSPEGSTSQGTVYRKAVQINSDELIPNTKHRNSLYKLLDLSCEKAFITNFLTPEDIERRQLFCRDMQHHLMEHCHMKIRLELFGSSSNGFGFPASDIDMCLTFDGEESEKVSRSILEPVKNALHSFNKCTRASVIRHAQVPIIKFKVKDEKFRHGDISLYNRLGVFNSRLLHTYANLDRRCKVLGYMFKQFCRRPMNTEMHKISSYAYMMMVIHFLQQCDPPVLPVLQELYSTAKQPVIQVDGWNAWFFENVDDISNQWPGYGMNSDTVGELWFKFLQYYASAFDFDNYVITIRQQKPRHKDAKIRNLNNESMAFNPKRKRALFWHHWTDRMILIEDPFDQYHNLTGNVRQYLAEDVIRIIRESYQKLEKYDHTFEG